MGYARVTDPKALEAQRLRHANGLSLRRRLEKAGYTGDVETRHGYITGGTTNIADRTLKRDCTLRALAMDGILPLEYMLTVLRDETADQARRDDMAKCAAPYLHPKLAQINHSGSLQQNVKVDLSSLSEAQLDALEQVFAPLAIERAKQLDLTSDETSKDGS